MYFDSEEVKNYLSEFQQILYNMQNKMYLGKMTNNITLDFIKCMISHHKAATEMCENLLKYTDYYPLIEVAQNIINTEEHNIRQMKKIMKMSKKYLNYPEEVNDYMRNYLNITGNMIYEMDSSLKSMDINLDFISEMLPHHKGAILICQNVLNYNINPDLRILANNIIRTQNESINQLKKIKNHLLQYKTWYNNDGEIDGIYMQNQKNENYPW